MAFSFKKAENPRFASKVEVPVPNDKGGHDRQTFVAYFKRTDTDELVRLSEQRMSDAELVTDRLVGWDMTDADTGEAVPFSPEMLKALLKIQPSPKYIAAAFWRDVMGGKS